MSAQVIPFPVRPKVPDARLRRIVQLLEEARLSAHREPQDWERWMQDRIDRLLAERLETRP